MKQLSQLIGDSRKISSGIFARGLIETIQRTAKFLYLFA
jgi:hypothetical protein